MLAKPLYISSEFFLVEDDSLSPSMTYTFEGVEIAGLTDSSLKIFTDPIAYYEDNYALYCEDYVSLRDLYALYPRAASLNYSYDDRSEILFKNRKYLSLRHTHVAFTGGAHPNTISTHWIIDRKTGATVRFSEYFLENSEIGIKSLLDEALNEMFTPENIKTRLFSTDYPVSNDIYVTKRGVVFQYDAYEIACYAQGPIEVFVPFKKLKSFMK